MEWAEGHDFSEEALKRFKIVSAEERWYIASLAFGVLEEKAKTAIPKLIEMLRKDFGEPDSPGVAVASAQSCVSGAARQRSWALASALAGIGGETILPLTSLLSEPNAVLRRNAAYALGEGGFKSELAVPALLTALNDPDAEVRSESAGALGQIRRRPQQVVPALVSTLEDINSGVRASSARALGDFGAEARSAMPALLLWLKVEDPATQHAAALALVRVNQDVDVVVTALIENLHSRQASVRTSAASVLGMLGGEARAAIPALESLLSDSERVVRGDVITSVSAQAKAALARIQTLSRPREAISNE
jgi:HEAT repeat protein